MKSLNKSLIMSQNFHFMGEGTSRHELTCPQTCKAAAHHITLIRSRDQRSGNKLLPLALVFVAAFTYSLSVTSIECAPTQTITTTTTTTTKLATKTAAQLALPDSHKPTATQQQQEQPLETLPVPMPLLTHQPASSSPIRHLIKRSGISDQRLAEIQMIRALKKQLERASKMATNGENSSAGQQESVAAD